MGQEKESEERKSKKTPKKAKKRIQNQRDTLLVDTRIP